MQPLVPWILITTWLLLQGASRCGCRGENARSYPFDDPNSVGAAESSDQAESAASDAITPHKSYSTPAGKTVKVFDNAVDANRLALLRLVSEPYVKDDWQFLHEDGAAGGGMEVGGGAGNMPWSTRVDAGWFATTEFGRSLAKLVSDSWQRALLAYDIRFVALRRGDDTTVTPGVRDEWNEVRSVLYATQRKWEGNFYGESIFYDEQEEIMAACQPKFLRLVAWDASIPYLLRPPAMSYATVQYMLVVRWTANASLVRQAERERAEYVAETKRGLAEGLFTTGDRAVPTDLRVQDYETQHVVTRTMKKNVHVFDKLLNRSDVDALRIFAKRFGGFVFNDYSVGDEGSDNVQWIGKFNIGKFVQSKYWKIIRKVVEYTSGGGSTWYPYDIACNVVRSTDHTRIHGDVRNDQDTEWTLLIYLSPEWDAGSYGETAWFTEAGVGQRMSNDVDIETEVQPLYGRVAIFEGLIPHAARPPSATYRGPRYSFAVKMARTQWLSARNQLLEEFHERIDSLQLFAAIHKNFKEMMKLSAADSGVGFNGKFAKRYWAAFLAQDDDRRYDVVSQMFQATENDGVKLNALLNYLVDIMNRKIDMFVEASSNMV